MTVKHLTGLTIQFFLEHSWIMVVVLLCVGQWSDFPSEHFCVMNGVREGGFLSHTLCTA